LLDRAREEAKREGLAEGDLAFEWSTDMRYERQTTEIRVELPEVPAQDLRAALERHFHARHEQLFSYRSPEPVALVNLRLKVISPGSSVSFASIGRAFLEGANEPSAERWREAYFGPARGLLRARILKRADLRNTRVDGPLVVEEFDSTVVVPPGWTAELDGLGNIMIVANGA
jgi:N-methylhydantoinase A